MCNKRYGNACCLGMISLIGFTIFTCVQHLQRHPTKFYSHSQHCVKQEADGGRQGKTEILFLTTTGLYCSREKLLFLATRTTQRTVPGSGAGPRSCEPLSTILITWHDPYSFQRTEFLQIRQACQQHFTGGRPLGPFHCRGELPDLREAARMCGS